ncbi:MAG: LPS-assembly protein [Sphingomonadales bacterium]|nr:LPS-assembly protein [Sphingomonadales bacterium]
MKKLNLICLTALPLLLCLSAAASAQTEARPNGDEVPPAQSPAPQPPNTASTDPAPATAPPTAQGERQVAFSANELTFDSNSDLVTATGDVRMNSEGNNLRSDRILWNRKTDEVRAQGNVRLVTPEGNIVYGDNVVLTDAMKNGVIENLLLVLEDGGRLAADRAERKDGYITLYRAAYSPCAVLSPTGCPKNPTWQINAVKVVHDPYKHRIHYKGASLQLFGARLIALPFLSHPDGQGESGSGLLVPEIRLSSRNGLELSAPYYVRIAPNRDATITPHIFTGVLPMLEAQYRQVTHLGAFQLNGYVTSGDWIDIDPVNNAIQTARSGLRGYVEGNGRFQLDPYWSVTFAGRYTTDKTFLRRYDISRDVRLRSVVNAERIDDNSYISIAGWAFQGLRTTDVGGQQPLVLPAIDARWRLPGPLFGGRLQLQANSLAILRTAGQDTQRAFASALWERRSITRWGQELVLTGYVRGDVYHTTDTLLTTTPIYRGTEGWHARGIAAAAAELRWPLVGPFMGGIQTLTPRLQVVASPPTGNLSIPNEDARSVDLEDSNLFELNRFPGYDRWEDGPRVTYGFDWALDLPGIAVRTTLGQSYRLNSKPSILPPGTGLSDRFSDVVGRTNVRIGRKLELVHRFRIDKTSLAVRRNEVDAVFGSSRTYAIVGYLKLNRNINSIEDLPDREEIRLSGRLQIARYWSVFGSTTIDLTTKQQDPASLSDSFQPVRHRIGINYDDDCLELGVTWRRDYDTSTALRRGSTFLFRVALKNLGR